MITLLIAALIAAEPLSPDRAHADPPERSIAEKLNDLKVLYDQSCGAREYGSYDDLCDGLTRQIKDYKRSIARDENASKRTPHAPVPSVSAPVPAATPAAAAAKPQA